MPLHYFCWAIQAREGSPAADKSFQDGVGSDEEPRGWQGDAEAGSGWWMQEPGR